MATVKETVGTASEGVTGPAAGDDEGETAPRLSSERVWREIAGASFAVLGYVTPAGEPRSSGAPTSFVMPEDVAPHESERRHRRDGHRHDGGHHPHADRVDEGLLDGPGDDRITARRPAGCGSRSDTGPGCAALERGGVPAPVSCVRNERLKADVTGAPSALPCRDAAPSPNTTTGLSHDSVRQMRDAWGIDDPDEVQLDAPGAECILDGVLDAVSDKRVRRITGRHRVGNAVRHDEERDAGHGSTPAPRIRHVVRRPAMTAPIRPTPSSKNSALTVDILNQGAWRLGVSPSRSELKSRSPPTPNGCSRLSSAPAMNPSTDVDIAVTTVGMSSPFPGARHQLTSSPLGRLLLPQRLHLQPRGPPLPPPAARNESCPLEHVQTLRHGRQTHRERRGQLVTDAFPRRQPR